MITTCVLTRVCGSSMQAKTRAFLPQSWYRTTAFRVRRPCPGQGSRNGGVASGLNQTRSLSKVVLLGFEIGVDSYRAVCLIQVIESYRTRSITGLSYRARASSFFVLDNRPYSHVLHGNTESCKSRSCCSICRSCSDDAFHQVTTPTDHLVLDPATLFIGGPLVEEGYWIWRSPNERMSAFE